MRDLLTKGDTIAVVATETAVDENGKRVYEYTVNKFFGEKFATTNGATTYGKAVVNKGESYILRDGTWEDWTDHRAALDAKYGAPLEGIDVEYDNFSIKLYGSVKVALKASKAALSKAKITAKRGKSYSVKLKNLNGQN